MQISVIIPSFNRAQTLFKAIDSVLNQSVFVHEIIVVDDGSTDETQSLLKPYLAQHEAIKVIRFAQNQGVSAARNAGVKAAQNAWLAFLDSDDTWLPSKLEKQIQAQTNFPDIKIFHTEEIWIRNGKRVNAMNKHAKPDGWIYEASLPLCCVSPSSILLHRSVLAKCGVFDESLPACEDYDLWLRLFSQYPAKLVDEPLLIKTGGHNDQLSAKYWGMDRFRITALRKMLDSDLLSHRQRELTLQMLIQKCLVISLGARKRAKLDRAKKYDLIAEKYSQSALIA